MKRIDAQFETDLERELASAPLRHKGFTNELRQRIESRIEGETSSLRPGFPLVGASLSTFAVVAAIAAFFLFRPESFSLMLTKESAQPTMQVVEPIASVKSDEQSAFVSGVLLGLRADDSRETTYRTLYIAPRQNEPAVVAQGSGILVPYKRDFWRIDPLQYETVSDKYRFFVSRPATERIAEGNRTGPALFVDNPAEKVVQTEKIVFAANTYVSLVTTSEVTTSKETRSSTKAWTTTIPDLKGKRHPVPLSQALATTSNDYATEAWFVTRETGKWIAHALIGDARLPLKTPAALLQNTADYHPLNVSLPVAIVNHDELCCEWNDISKQFPEAVDTFSSPGQDMTLIVTNDQLLVYGSPDQLTGEPALTVKLKSNESVIMAQWATDHYVEEWTQKTAALLR